MEHWCNGSISVFQTEDIGSNPICFTRKISSIGVMVTYLPAVQRLPVRIRYARPENMEHWCRWLTYLPAMQMTPVQVRYVPPKKIWSIGVMVTYLLAMQKPPVQFRHVSPQKIWSIGVDG